MTVPSQFQEERVTTDTVRILLVDDDEHWAWATGQLLKQTDNFNVETAHSLEAGRQRFADLDPDCVVCDYHLGDGDGLALLETVREADPDRPFLLVTGKGDEGIASEAIRNGVDDYIRKGRDDEDDLLANRIGNLVRGHRAERTLDRERRTKTAVLDVLRETTTELDCCRQFCRRLVETDPYALAWIGSGRGDGPLPRTSAGRDGYLDAVADHDELSATEPARRAYTDTESIVVSPIDAGSANGWQAVATDHGFRSVVAVPIRYDGVTFGVLAVYLDAAGGEAAAERRAIIEEYAESVGYALQSLDRKRSLLSDQPIRAEVSVSDRAVPLVAIADRLPAEARIESPSTVSRDDGTTLYLTRIRAVSESAVETAVGATDGVTLLEVTETDERLRCTVAADEPTPEGTLADRGAQFDRTVVEDGTATVSVRIRNDRPVSQLAAAVEANFEDPTVSTVWTAPQRGEGTDDPFVGLTDKQRTVLRHAYHEGYFERPRAANATEIAERLGISRQTFAQHLRAAQRKVFGSW